MKGGYVSTRKTSDFRIFIVLQAKETHSLPHIICLFGLEEGKRGGNLEKEF